jgi:hypothetical protein
LTSPKPVLHADRTAHWVLLRSSEGIRQFTFTLELSGDSAFAHMTGHNSVLVTLQPSTRMFIFSLGDGCISCITNQPVRVRGLLFFSKGQYQLVADQLAEN